MKNNIVRGVLTILLAAVAVFDIAEGILVLTRICAPPAQYQGTLFNDATIPMLVVAIVVGGSALMAAVMVFMRHVSSMFIAAAAGIIMIAWEIIQIVVTHQPSSIFLVAGLAVIALAEYLWMTEFGGHEVPTTQHLLTRIALIVIAAIVATSAIDGGMALLRGELSQFASLDLLAGTPFSDYTIPGLVLVIVVGGSALIAAATVFIQREWAVLVSALAGLLMAGYEAVEVISINSKIGSGLPTALALQLFYFVLGLAVVGLAGSLWMREYRRQHFHLRPVSHA